MNAAVVVVGDYLSLFNLSTVDPISVRCYAQYESSTLRCQKSANVLIVNTVERAERLALFLYAFSLVSVALLLFAFCCFACCVQLATCLVPRTVLMSSSAIIVGMIVGHTRQGTAQYLLE